MRAFALAVALFIATLPMCAPPSAKASGRASRESRHLDQAAPAEAMRVITRGDHLSDAVLLERPTQAAEFPALGAFDGAVRSVRIAFTQLDVHGFSLSADEAVSIICAPQYVWSCETALAITWRESNWQPHAYNAKSGCAGLWQIHPLHGYSLSTRFDPEASTAIAYDLWLREGWGPWRIQ